MGKSAGHRGSSFYAKNNSCPYPEQKIGLDCWTRGVNMAVEKRQGA